MIQRTRIHLLLSVLLAGVLPTAMAAEKIRIGIIAHMSGPFATTGTKYEQGVKAFQKAYGNTAGGREVEVVFRDLAGGDPAKAKQLTEELILRDRVSLIGGYYLSPESLAAAPVLTEAKIPAVIFNGAAVSIPKASPFIIRPAATQAQSISVHAKYAWDSGKRKAYVAVSDYSAGHEVLDEFKKRFTALGGTIVGEEKMPLNTMDFSAAAERIAAAKPDFVELFIPNGAPSVALSKALRARGILGRDDIMVMGQGYIDEPTLTQYDDSIIGAYDTQIYALPAQGNENDKFKATMKSLYPEIVPGYETASAYDGMMILYRMIASQAGKPFHGAAAVKAVVNWGYEGARGPQKIEPDRNLVTNVYVRKVVKEGGRLRNAVAYTARNVPSAP